MLALYRVRPPGRGAQRLPGGPPRARRGARARAEPGPAAARAPDPRAGPALAPPPASRAGRLASTRRPGRSSSSARSLAVAGRGGRSSCLPVTATAATEAADARRRRERRRRARPETGALLAAIPLGTAPANIAVGEGGVWVLDADDRTDLADRSDASAPSCARSAPPRRRPTLAAGAGAVWVGNAARDARFSSFPTSVSRLDPESGVVDATIRLPGQTRPVLPRRGVEPADIAVDGRRRVGGQPDRTVSRIDPRTNRVVARVDGVSAESIAAGDGGRVGRRRRDRRGSREIDPRTNRVARRIEVAAESLTALAVGAGAVWVADPLGGSVWRVNPARSRCCGTIPLELGVGWRRVRRRARSGRPTTSTARSTDRPADEPSARRRRPRGARGTSPSARAACG